MDRTLRCEMLARLSNYEIADIVKLVGDRARQRLVVITEPTVGMIMARAIEGARGEVFNFGEVLVTECLVQIDGHEGWSMVMGSRPSCARAVATIDAAIESGHLSADIVDGTLNRLIALQDAEMTASRAELAATRVQFDTQ